MERKSFYKKKNHKGISGVIAAVIMIALVLAAVVIIWSVINNMLKEQMGGVESCFGNYNKVTINSIYTCYNPTDDTFQFSLNIEDIEVDKVVVSVSSAGSTNSYTLTKENQTISGLANYGSTGFGEDIITLPGKNAGKTYVANEIYEKPDLMKIAPVIGGQQCDVSDTLSGIEDCF